MPNLKKNTPIDDFEYWSMYGHHSNETKRKFSVNEKKLSKDEISAFEANIKSCPVRGRDHEVLLEFKAKHTEFVQKQLKLYNYSAKSSRKVAVKSLAISKNKETRYIKLCYKQDKEQILKKGFLEKFQNTSFYKFFEKKFGSRKSTLDSIRSTDKFNEIIKEREKHDPNSVVKLKDDTKLTVFQYSSIFLKSKSSGGYEVDASYLKNQDEIDKYNLAQSPTPKYP